MCRSRASADAIPPSRRASARSPKSSRTSNSKSFASSSSNPSHPSSSSSASLNLNSFNFFSNNNNSSSSTSAARQPSLSRIKQFLPDTPLIYPLPDLRLATGNFLSGRLSPTSWRCTLRGRDAVVCQRRLKRPLDLPELGRRLSAITKSHHSSLVKLLGASVSGNFVYLVYEFVEGANLSDCLRNRVNRAFTVLSSWVSRMQIAADLAHGLDYIHHCAGSATGGGGAGFVHNHIKSSSIIVTEPSLNARICHFGTAELCGEAAEVEEEGASEPGGSRNLKRTNSRGVKLEGTRGYMSPEYRITGVATQKSDVFAFGVVILELLSGEEALRYQFDGEDSGGGYKRTSVVESAREAVEGGRVRRWVDARLKDSYPVEVAERMVSLGLECVEEEAERRPDMSQVSAVISKLYLESKAWAEKFGMPVDFSVSMAPR
ncbi:protein LYK5-like [Syzygium oleosum]|uniref:protein LYK5-like n=1 Tax=Syzygium oleosum TaxID=219896 RepID=UPI0024B90BD5|nr:protein LYK5-like [Syzygium oleosum]